MEEGEEVIMMLQISSHHLDGVMYASRENSTAIRELMVCYSTDGGLTFTEQTQHGQVFVVRGNFYLSFLVLVVVRE
jgi:hypothetical protein